MAIASAGTATQLAVLDTPHTLDTETTPGVYVLVVDTGNLALGDKVTLTIKTKAAAGGTSRIAYKQTYSDAQAKPIKYSPPIPVDTEIVCILEQTDGTGRNFLWNLLRM